MCVTLRSVRHWACAASFHSQMLVHLAALEGKQEPLAAKAALEQYREDLMQIIPAYRLNQVLGFSGYLFILVILLFTIQQNFYFAPPKKIINL